MTTVRRTPSRLPVIGILSPLGQVMLAGTVLLSAAAIVLEWLVHADEAEEPALRAIHPDSEVRVTRDVEISFRIELDPALQTRGFLNTVVLLVNSSAQIEPAGYIERFISMDDGRGT